MHPRTARRVGHSAEMVPAVARVAVRRLRRRGRATRVPVTVWSTDTAHGTLEATPPLADVLLDGIAIGRLSCRIDAGTSTAECFSDVPAAVAPAVVDLVVASVADDVRRVAWFVPVDDVDLETTLDAAGFVCEGWAAPPIGDDRQHRQWALLT